MREVSLDTSPSRWTAIRGGSQEFSLVPQNAIPYSDVRGVDHSVAAIEATRRLVQSLAAAAGVGSEAEVSS